jgi:hypothetical protein
MAKLFTIANDGITQACELCQRSTAAREAPTYIKAQRK